MADDTTQPVPADAPPAVATQPDLPLPVGTPALQDKRLWLAVGAALFAALNDKLGLHLSQETILAILGLVGVFITQSQWGAVQKAKVAGQLAAQKVETTSDALKVLGGPAKALAFALALGLAFMPSRSWAEEPPPASAPDLPSKVEVVSGVVTAPGGRQVPVGQGCYLDAASCVATAKEVAQLRAENDELKKGPGASWLAVAVAGLVLVGGGFVLGRASK